MDSLSRRANWVEKDNKNLIILKKRVVGNQSDRKGTVIDRESRKRCNQEN